MLRFSQILNDVTHYIFETETTPDYPPDADGNQLVFVDITDRPEVQEGWGYDSTTGEFTAPPEPEPIPEPEPVPAETSIDQQILYETLYQTMILEMGGMM